MLPCLFTCQALLLDGQSVLGVRLRESYMYPKLDTRIIDLITDLVAIVKILDLRSIMGCPGGTCSVFMCTFRAKREPHCIFLGKKAFIITSILGDPGADSGGEGKSKRAGKYGTKEK